MLLGVDITLQAIDTVFDDSLSSAALAIEFMNLQTAYISLDNTKLSTFTLPLVSTSSDNTNFGRGTFAILEANHDIIDSLISSKMIALKVALIGQCNESSISEYSNGVLDDLKRIESIDKDSSDISASVSNKIFQQKTKVFGESAIIAFHPSLSVELVHSIGVSSAAGKVVFSVAIIDISKVSEYKKIGATGRIIPDLCEIQTQNEGFDFDMQNFLERNNESNADIEDIEESIISSDYGDDDAAENISIDSFLNSIRKTKETEITIVPKIEKEEVAPFHYKATNRNKSRGKHIYDSRITVSQSRDENWPPIVMTQNGVRILGVQEVKSNGNTTNKHRKATGEKTYKHEIDDSAIRNSDKDQKGITDPFESIDNNIFQHKFNKTVINVLITKDEQEKLMLLPANKIEKKDVD